MPKIAVYNLLYDDKACIFCHACEVACKQEHNIPRGTSWMKIVPQEIINSDNRLQMKGDLRVCRQCRDIPCAKACPAEAISKNEHGIVIIDAEKCTSCQACLSACTFNVLVIHPEEGIPTKCSLCFDRLENNQMPSCITVCPTNAIQLQKAGVIQKFKEPAWAGKKNSKEKILRSVCLMCHGGCGIQVHVLDGKVMKVEGDPESPLSHGSLCAKGLSATQLLYHPDRLRFPLKQTGSRGSGQWKRISWQEATQTIATKINNIKKQYGARQVAFATGTGRQVAFYLTRAGFTFGTPNARISNPHICFLPRLKIGNKLFGRSIQYDVENSKCILMVGANFFLSNGDQNLGARLHRGLASGARLICVDPAFSSTAHRAHKWLQVRPGTDGAFFLALLNVIIAEGLYDKSFVDRWTTGFDRLKEHIQQFNPEWAETVTGIPAADIRSVARIYATTKPACMVLGEAIEMNTNTTSTVQAAWLLPVLTGNIDIKGGNFFWESPVGNRFSELVGEGLLTEEQHSGSVASPKIQFYQQTGYDAWHAILDGKPYPLRALLIHGMNPMLSHENPRLVQAALQKVEFLSVMDQFMTPTAELADIVLPATTFLESNDISARFAGITHGSIFPCQRAVEPLAECKDDKQFFIELAKCAGFDFGFSSEEETLEWMLQPLGIDFPELCRRGFVTQPQREHKYEIGALRPDGKPGFNTFDGKIGLYSTEFEKLGLDPMPVYREPKESPVSRPDLAQEYPLILTSGRRIPFYFATQYRQIPWLRELAPDPIAEMHPETAKKYSLSDGDWVYLESPRGRCKQRLKVRPGILHGIVQAEHDWWFPEQGEGGFDVWKSNINQLTDSEPPYDAGCGSTPLRGLLCKVYKA